jgi:hypothetical protein
MFDHVLGSRPHFTQSILKIIIPARNVYRKTEVATLWCGAKLLAQADLFVA